MSVRLKPLDTSALLALPQNVREWIQSADKGLRELQRMRDAANSTPDFAGATVAEIKAELNAYLESMRG